MRLISLLFASLLMFSSFSQANETTPQASESMPQVELTTNMGTIVLELDATKAPISVADFLTYVDSGHYNNTVFHRVISDFMIQGGGFSVGMRQKATLPAIKNEAKNGLRNLRGTIAMARLPSPDSATSQFFINLTDNAFLDHGKRDYGYAVFGKVISGMDVVDQIGQTRTLPGDRPAENVVLIKAERVVAEAENQPAE